MIEFRENYPQRAGLGRDRSHQRRGRQNWASTPHPRRQAYRRDEDRGLKQALDKHGFDAAFGGARRDEEKSRAKERVFSFRDKNHGWDPKNQRPELWNLYNTKVNRGESIRVFPLSNWTELDVWQYIHLEQIPIVPLYFSAERPVVSVRSKVRDADHGR